MKLSYQVKHGVFDNSSGTDPTVKERIGTHQPKWDQWGRLTEPLLSTIPTLTVVGNHELEPQVCNPLRAASPSPLHTHARA